MITVAHVITSLGRGGAETMLLKLLQHTDRAQFSPHVFSLMAPPGALAERVEALGIPVEALGMARTVPNPSRLLQLAGRLRAIRADLVQTWMYHGDLVGGLAAKLSSVRLPVVWNIRQSNFEVNDTRHRTMLLARVCAALSTRLPVRIISCSDVARRTHIAMGYAESRFQVIPNGFDLVEFRPDPAARPWLRSEIGLAADAPLVGIVARFDPQKDHRTFVAAAALLHARMPDAHFVLCGGGMDTANAELMEWIARARLESVCHLLGERADVPRILAGLDLATLSSSSEGFPNVLGEAMACEVPCVATDVGDSALIVGDAGRIVPPRDPDALANAWAGILTTGEAARREFGQRARRRIVEHFSIARAARAYEAMYHSVVAATVARQPMPRLS